MAIVQGDQPKRLAWDRLGVIGRNALCDWISVARHLQGSVTQPYVRPWVVSSTYAAILVERPSLNPVQAVSRDEAIVRFKLQIWMLVFIEAGIKY